MLEKLFAEMGRLRFFSLGRGRHVLTQHLQAGRVPIVMDDVNPVVRVFRQFLRRGMHSECLDQLGNVLMGPTNKDCFAVVFFCGKDISRELF